MVRKSYDTGSLVLESRYQRRQTMSFVTHKPMKSANEREVTQRRIIARDPDTH